MSGISGRSGPPSQSHKSPKLAKPPDFDKLLPLIEDAGDAGLDLSKIKSKIIGGPKAQDPGKLRELAERLGSLVSHGAIDVRMKTGRAPQPVYFAAGRGPSVEKLSAAVVAFAQEPGTVLFSRADLAKKITGLDGLVLDEAIDLALQHHKITTVGVKKGATFYAAPDRCPSIDTAAAAIAKLVLGAGSHLLSKSELAKAMTEFDAPFFGDALQSCLDTHVLAEVTCGKPKAGARAAAQTAYYLHRDCALKLFGEALSSERKTGNAPLAFDDFLVVYRRLKSEQGGISTVNILDLLRALEVPKDALHALLITETKAGRVTIHPDTTGTISPEETAAGIRLPGRPEPFVTVVVKHS